MNVSVVIIMRSLDDEIFRRGARSYLEFSGVLTAFRKFNLRRLKAF